MEEKDINAMLANQLAGSSEGSQNTSGDAGQTPANNPAQGTDGNTGSGKQEGAGEGNQGQEPKAPSFLDDAQGAQNQNQEGAQEGSKGEGSGDPNIPENLEEIIGKKVEETLSQKEQVESAIAQAREQYGQDAFDEKEVRAAIAKGTDPQVAIYAAIGLKAASAAQSQGSINMSGRVPASAKNFTAPQNMSNEELEAAARDELNNLMNQA